MDSNGFYKVTIPLEELENVDELFFRQVQMNGNKVLKKFRKQYDETRNMIFSGVTVEGIYTTSEIKGIEGSEIHLDNEITISNEMLSGLFAESGSVTACVVTLHGYDRLEEEADDNLITLFLDGWGTAVAECAHVWLKKQIKQSFADKGLYMTNSWSPGQHNIDIRLQKELFAMLNPQTIGVTLTESFMMHPKKSISSFMGSSENQNAENIRACDFCELREKCPTAYVP